MDLHVTKHFVPPPGFRLASDYSRKDHHLSGPSSSAPTRIARRGLAALTNHGARDRPEVQADGVCRRPSLLKRCLPPLFAFTSAAIFQLLCGVSWHPPPRSAAGLLDPCFKTGRTTRASPLGAPWRVVTDVIVGRSRRRTRALPALVLCPPRGRSGLRRTLRVPAALPRCWVRTRIAPRPPPLAAHPFPSVHMGRLSRLGWRRQLHAHSIVGL